MDCSSCLLVHRASKLNEAGVDSLISGNFDLAIHHLNDALVLINQLLLTHRDQFDVASRSVSPFYTAALKINALLSHPQHDAIEVKPTTKEVPSLYDERFYVFNQALLFTSPPFIGIAGNPDASGATPSRLSGHPLYQAIRADYIQISFIWSIIHFNMALVLHQQVQQDAYSIPHGTTSYGTRGNCTSPSRQEQVVLFYKLCLQNLWVIPASSTTMNMLMLCAVNNLTHVCLQLPSSPKVPTPGNHPGKTTTTTSPRCYGNRPRRTPVDIQTELVHGLLLRAIGKVICNDSSLTPEQHDQVTEMSINHIVISALRPSYVAPGA